MCRAQTSTGQFAFKGRADSEHQSSRSSFSFFFFFYLKFNPRAVVHGTKSSQQGEQILKRPVRTSSGRSTGTSSCSSLCGAHQIASQRSLLSSCNDTGSPPPSRPLCALIMLISWLTVPSQKPRYRYNNEYKVSSGTRLATERKRAAMTFK